MRYTGFNFCFQNQLAPLQPGAYCDSSGGGPAKAISRSTAERKPSLSAVSNSKLEAAASQARAAAAAATATAAAAVAGSSSRNGQITIHVFDEARGARKDFSCDLPLLLREMGYFKGHLGGVLGPHELEMSVHCDIAVFSWLLEYVKASRGPGRGLHLTLVHFSAQLKRILWDRGAFRGCLGGVQEVSGGNKEYQGVFRVYFMSETAQVELRSGRV